MGTEIGKAAMQPLALKTSASASLSRGFGKWTAALQTRRALFRRGASWEVLGSRRGHVVPRSSMLSADRRQLGSMMMTGSAAIAPAISIVYLKIRGFGSGLAFRAE